MRFLPTLLLVAAAAPRFASAHPAPSPARGPAPAAAPAAVEAKPESVQAEVPSIRVIVVRHAEAGGEPANDPGLTEAGVLRAACLHDRLLGEELSHVFASPFRRSRETASRIVAGRGLDVQVRDPLPADELAREIAALPAGSSILVVGHSNTAPALVAALGGQLDGLVEEQGQMAFPRDQFDRLITLRLQPAEGGARLASLEDVAQGCPPAPR